MSNTSYCRFQDAAQDFTDCVHDFAECLEALTPLSDDELRAARKLIVRACELLIGVLEGIPDDVPLEDVVDQGE
jgi:hypothetical protein